MDSFRRHSSESVSPNKPPRSSTATPRASLPQLLHAPLPTNFNPRASTTPETGLFNPPKPKRHSDIPAPAYSEQYIPPPSTAYYPPLTSHDVCNLENGIWQKPYKQQQHPPPYQATQGKSNRPWVWEAAPWGACRNSCCSSPTLCGFRTKNMPPSQFMFLLISTVGLSVAIIVVVVLLSNRNIEMSQGRSGG